jgi:hypothetical protein
MNRSLVTLSVHAGEPKQTKFACAILDSEGFSKKGKYPHIQYSHSTNFFNYKIWSEYNMCIKGRLSPLYLNMSIFFIKLYYMFREARGSVTTLHTICNTTLQAGRSEFYSRWGRWIFFNLPNPFRRTMVLGSTQSLTDIERHGKLVSSYALYPRSPVFKCQPQTQLFWFKFSATFISFYMQMPAQYFIYPLLQLIAIIQYNMQFQLHHCFQAFKNCRLTKN